MCGRRKWAIRKSDGYSKCYRCDSEFKGFADYTLSVALKLPKKALSALLYGVVVSTLESEELRPADRWVDHWGDMGEEDTEAVDIKTWPPEMLPSPTHFELESEQGAPGLAYLESRGVPLAVALEYGIKYDTANERVVFPIIVEGKLRGWQGRLVRRIQYTDKKGRLREVPKALTEGEVGGKVLLFQDRLKDAPHGIITEGPFDALKCHLCGGNTATMGKSVTKEQLDIYVRHFGLKRIYLGLDDDAAAEISRITRELSWYPDVEVFRITTPPGREDLGDATMEEVLAAFQAAEPFRPTSQVRYIDDSRYR
jgi:DNA primase